MDRILVVVPTYNESQNLPILASQVLNLGIDGLEMLIVDDDSPDGTGEIAERLSVEYPGRISVLHRVDGERGLGRAYVAGFESALKSNVDYVIGIDADLSHCPRRIPDMLQLMPECDLVIGSRYVPGGGVDESWNARRRLLSRGAQLCVRLLLETKTKDVTGAFRCYSQHTLRQLRFDLMDLDGFSFLIEIVLQAEALGLRIQEIPILFRGRHRGNSKMTPLIILRALRRVAAIRLKRYNRLLTNCGSSAAV